MVIIHISNHWNWFIKKASLQKARATGKNKSLNIHIFCLAFVNSMFFGPKMLQVAYSTLEEEMGVLSIYLPSNLGTRLLSSLNTSFSRL